jgi:carboxypeptidase C (cathepsin A)
VNGQPLHYRATAGYLPIESSASQPHASLFFVAYERLAGGRRTEDRGQMVPLGAVLRNRPLTFAFNGGPGASAVWLHLGAFGPKRAVLADEGTALPAVNTLADNDSTWLEFTDLVFVDPVGTGFSRAAPGVEPNQFFEVQRDIEVAAEFVRLFVTKNERWLSPSFIVGESYGTTRAVSVTRRLQDRYGLYLRGLILLSSALNLQVISFDPGNDLPYVLSLPSYTAVALYHGRLREKPRLDLDQSLQRIQAWSLGQYIAVLAKGDSLSPADLQAVARSLAEYTGLSQDMIARNRLRIGNFAFAQELLAGQGRVLGLLDGRVTAPSIGRRGTWTDPSLFISTGPFVAAFNSYVRTDLGFQTDQPYIYLSDRANEAWNWGSGRRGYLNVAPILAEAMGLDNRLVIFAAAGYYDLTTPFLSQEYVYNHLDLPAGLRGNITLRRYPAGHQIYTSPEALRQLTADVKVFLAGSPLQSSIARFPP